MNSLLSNLEEKLKAFFEGGINRLFFSSEQIPLQDAMSTLIQEEMESFYAENQALPDTILICFSPEKKDVWEVYAEDLSVLVQKIEYSYYLMGQTFPQGLRVELCPDGNLGIDQVDVRVKLHSNFSDETRLLETAHPGPECDLPEGAYFILNNDAQLPLTLPVINIGRHGSNDIIIRDGTVAPNHVQLRAKQGRYLLFNLSTNDDTRINDRRFSQAFLNVGDVVRIGQNVLIYNQEVHLPPLNKQS